MSVWIFENKIVVGLTDVKRKMKYAQIMLKPCLKRGVLKEATSNNKAI